VIVKQYRDGAHYLLNSRSQWLKLKKFVVKSELSDTLDLVPIAAYWGKGKRSGTYSAYVLAAYNTNENVFEAVCKIGTGFSEEFLQMQTKFFASKTTP
jgi:DNA ligase-1